MDIEDSHIAQAFEMKELLGYSVKEIAAVLDLSEPRIYQLVARAKAIGREYLAEKRLKQKKAVSELITPAPPLFFFT